MKKYRVKNTPLLEKKLDRYVGYLFNVKKSSQAAQALLKDFSETRKSLEKTAGALPLPPDENLRKRDLKRVNLQRHNYFLLFRIRGDVVEIVSMFHGLENYSEKLEKEE